MLSFFKLAISFYRRFLWYSLFLNILFVVFHIPFGLALVYKLLLTLMLFWTYKFPGREEQMTFYNNLKLSTIRLFTLSFIMDISLLSIIYFIFGRIL